MTPMTITACLTNRCNFSCEYCIARCGDPDTDTEAELSVPQLIKWMNKYHPGANVTLTGGEPLLLDNIVESVDALIANGNKVCILTNGSLLNKRAELLERDIVWQVSHHPQEQSIGSFLRRIAPLKDKKHFVCRVYSRELVSCSMAEAAAAYEGFNFRWSKLNNGLRMVGERYDKDDLGNIASGVLRIVGIYGEVRPCGGGSEPPCGNVYDMTFDAEQPKRIDPYARGCVESGYCGAYHTAFLFNKLSKGKLI